MMNDYRALEPIARSGPEERAYFLKRANDHRQLSEKSQESDSRLVHLRLQRLYEARAASLGMVQAD